MSCNVRRARGENFYGLIKHAAAEMASAQYFAVDIVRPQPEPLALVMFDLLAEDVRAASPAIPSVGPGDRRAIMLLHMIEE